MPRGSSRPPSVRACGLRRPVAPLGSARCTAHSAWHRGHAAAILAEWSVASWRAWQAPAHGLAPARLGARCGRGRRTASATRRRRRVAFVALTARHERRGRRSAGEPDAPVSGACTSRWSCAPPSLTYRPSRAPTARRTHGRRAAHRSRTARHRQVSPRRRHVKARLRSRATARRREASRRSRRFRHASLRQPGFGAAARRTEASPRGCAACRCCPGAPM